MLITAGIGGLAGGAAGAIIGSFAGGAVAGGLFGIPLGAVAGYYIGDQMTGDRDAREAQSQKLDELAQLREENERLKRSARLVENDEPRAVPAKAVVGFDFDDSGLSGGAEEASYPMLAWLKEDSEHNAAVFGYTDSVGSAAYNKNLSEQRARAVRDFLVESGVNANNLEIYAMGEINPDRFQRYRRRPAEKPAGRGRAQRHAHSVGEVKS